jgi:hypothetical protein
MQLLRGWPLGWVIDDHNFYMILGQLQQLSVVSEASLFQMT